MVSMLGKCCKRGTWGLLLWGLVLLVGIAWLGNDMKWWSVTFPFLPVLVILVALRFLLRRYVWSGK